MDEQRLRSALSVLREAVEERKTSQQTVRADQSADHQRGCEHAAGELGAAITHLARATQELAQALGSTTPARTEPYAPIIAGPSREPAVVVPALDDEHRNHTWRDRQGRTWRAGANSEWVIDNIPFAGDTEQHGPFVASGAGEL